MPPAPLQIQLSSEDHEQVQTLLSVGIQPVRSILRALSLIHMMQGVSPLRMSAVAGIAVGKRGESTRT